MAGEQDFGLRLTRALRPLVPFAARLRVVELFRALWELANDPNQPPLVVVVTARRMACLFAVAMRCGLSLGDRLVVVMSDRFTLLNEPPGGWGESRVVLVDDVVDTGATIHERASVVSAVAGRDVETSALFVTGTTVLDMKWAPELGEPLQVGSDDSRSIAIGMSETFGRELVPLMTDFPVSSELLLSEADLNELLSSQSWAPFEVTNSIVAGRGVRSYTLLPRFDAQEVAGLPCALVDICKLRVFVRSDVEGERVRVVPMVTVKPVTSESVKQFFGAMGYNRLSGDSNGVALSVVTYGLSSHLWGVVQDDDLLAPSHIQGLGIDAALTDLYLGPVLAGRFEREFHPELLRGLSTLEPTVPKADVSTEPVDDLATATDGCVVGDSLVEDAARAIERKKPVLVSDLRKALGVSTAVLGLQIDVLNDLGWAVPGSVTANDVDYRCYSGGEISDRPLEPGLFGGRWASIVETAVAGSEPDPPSSR